MSIYLHSQESLYQNFSKSVGALDQILIHPRVENIYVQKSSTVEHRDIEKLYQQWKIQTIHKIESYLQKKTSKIFESVVRKDLLAHEIFQLFLDIGFEKNNLRGISQDKFSALEEILFHAVQKPSVEPIDFDKPIHIVGYSFEKHFLSFFHYVLPKEQIRLWLVDHHGYPQWINPSFEQKKFYFKPLNQMTYENKLACFDYFYSILSQVPGDAKIGIVINQEHQQNWFIKQCRLRDINVDSAQDFTDDDFSIMIGSLSDLASFSMDILYIADFWFEHTWSSRLWSSQEKQTLHSNAILLSDSYYNHMLIDTLSRQTQTMYFLFDRSKKIPSLFFHPDEHADPINPQEIKYQYSLKNIGESFAKHRAHVNAKTWPDEEVSFLPQETSITLSPTSLTQISRCPRQYYFRHKMKAKEQVEPDQVFKQNPKDFGIMMHRFLQDIFDTPDIDQNFASTFDRLQQSITQEYQKRMPTAYQAVWKLEMSPYFSGLYQYLTNELASGWTVRNVEYRWEDTGTAFEDLYSNQQLSITWTGQIDRIDMGSSGLRLIDYKTGNVTKKKADLFEDGKFIQMPLYLHFIAAKSSENNIQSEIHQITSTGVVPKAHLTLDDYIDQKDTLSELVTRWITIAQNNVYHPNPGPGTQNCRNCSYVSLCSPYLDTSLENKGAL